MNLKICALFYKLAKMVIQLKSLIIPGSVEEKINELKSQHKEIRKNMVVQIQKRVKITKHINEVMGIYDV